MAMKCNNLVVTMMMTLPLGCCKSGEREQITCFGFGWRESLHVVTPLAPVIIIIIITVIVIVMMMTILQ